MRVPLQRVATASIPRSIPVSCPVGGKDRSGTSAHEKQTDQPSASWELVTVLRRSRDRLVTVLSAPSNGLRPAHRETPDLGEDEDTGVQRRSIAELLVGERGVASGRRLGTPYPTG